jgi:tetratricopeptide (TPR) repeat protein
MSPKGPEDTNLLLTLLRVLAGLTEKELAALLQLSDTHRLSKFERGRKDLSLPELEEIAAVMGYPAWFLQDAFGFVQRSRWALSVGARDERGEAGPLSALAETEAILAEHQLFHSESLPQMISRIKLAVWTRFDRALANDLWDVLRPWTPEARLETVQESSRLFHRWSLCEQLVEQSLQAAGDDGDKALELAELACVLAERLPGADGWRRRAQGYCLFHVGNAWRVKGELQLARATFERAQALWDDGEPCDPGAFAPARVLGLRATLLREERKLSESLPLYDEALQLPVTRERPYLLLGKSKALEEQVEYREAVAVLAAAREVIPEGDLLLHLSASFKEAVLCCHLEQYTEASALLPELHGLVEKVGENMNRLRLTWLEGRIARGFDRNQLALAAFAKVRHELAARKVRYDQALVTLEIAEILAEEGRHHEVQELTRELVPVFEDQGVHREAARALRLFCEAAERQTLTVELARQLVRYLYRARNNPELRFQPL